MQALVLAGGAGTRLQPLTLTTPKPVMPLAGRPFLTFMLDWARFHGVDEAILSCGFMSDEVKARMRVPLVVDGRNFLDREQLVAAGFTYEGIGR